MSSDVSIQMVRAALAKPRPGIRAQAQMMPRPRPPGTNSASARNGGVLLLVYPVHGRLHLVLTRRADSLPNHKGQISLPGGAQDPGESFETTALREAQEELDLDPTAIQVLGQLTPMYIPASNYCVRTVVGYAPARPAFRPDPREVAEILEVSLSVLLDPATVQEEEWELHGRAVRVPFFAVNEHKIWGATAMILAEFVALVRSENEMHPVF